MAIDYVKSKVFSWIFILLTPIVTIGLLAMVIIVVNKIIVAVSGLLVISILTYSLAISLKSKNIDRQTKKFMWGVLIVVFSVIGTMIFKITA